MKRLIWLLILLSGWHTSLKAKTLTVVSDRLMAPVMETWLKNSSAEADHRIGNALTAVQQLIHGRADLIAVGRPLSDGELHQIRQLGIRIRSLPVGIDAIAIYVARRSFLKALSLAQLAQLYGTHPCHRPRANTPAMKTLVRFGSGPATASHYHFIHQALCNGPLKPDVSLLDSDLKLIKTVARNHNAIGFASAGINAANIRPLALKSGTGMKAYLPSRQHLRTGRYPLTHFLYLHLLSGNSEAEELTRFSLSPRGQLLLDRRFVALPKPMRVRAIQALSR